MRRLLLFLLARLRGPWVAPDPAGRRPAPEPPDRLELLLRHPCPAALELWHLRAEGRPLLVGPGLCLSLAEARERARRHGAGHYRASTERDEAVADFEVTDAPAPACG